MSDKKIETIKEKILFAFSSHENKWDICDEIKKRLESQFGGKWVVVLYEKEHGYVNTFNYNDKGCWFSTQYDEKWRIVIARYD